MYHFIFIFKKHFQPCLFILKALKDNFVLQIGELVVSFFWCHVRRHCFRINNLFPVRIFFFFLLSFSPLSSYLQLVFELKSQPDCCMIFNIRSRHLHPVQSCSQHGFPRKFYNRFQRNALKLQELFHNSNFFLIKQFLIASNISVVCDRNQVSVSGTETKVQFQNRSGNFISIFLNFLNFLMIFHIIGEYKF